MIKLHKNITEAGNHFRIAKKLIKKRINSVLKKGSIGTTNIIPLNPNTITYLRDLLNDSNLRSLILASPENLQSMISGLTVTYPNFMIPNSNENLILRNVFVAHGYKHKEFDKLMFIKSINIDTCPYCNRNYIYYLSRVGQLKPQIDHFYPTNIYPFLALTFYNMIPSCQTCNGFGAKEGHNPLKVNLVNPYLIENHHFKFTYKINHINFLNPLFDKNSLEVKLRHQLIGHTSVFKLDKLYQQHSDHVLELIVKSKVAYSSKYRNYLHSFKGLKFNDIEIDRMILGNYTKEEEIHKRPLAKMYQDIGIELGLIKR
jgi:hypothetical protein